VAGFSIPSVQSVPSILGAKLGAGSSPYTGEGDRAKGAVEGAAAGSAPPAIDPKKLKKIHETAQGFESSFLAIMLQQMFTATDVAAPFGGGQGEQMFKSFLTEAMAKQMTKAGGVGIADTVSREMLKLQGLS
jgi:hypothetical protein